MTMMSVARSSATRVVWRSHHGSFLAWSSLSNSRQWLAASQHVAKCRFASSSAESNDQHMILYQRTKSLTIPRAIFGGSIFQSIYWIWYVVDFCPAINQSPIPELHVDPLVGFIGLTFAAIMNVAAIIYPKQLVSKLAWHPPSRKLQVWLYRLPWIKPSRFPLEYQVGSISLHAPESKIILDQWQGSLQRYRGHLPLSVANRRLPLLMEVYGDADVPDSNMLLQILVDPERFTKSQQQRQRRNRGSEPEHIKHKTSPRTPQR